VTAQIALAPALKFNGGGHINHSIFWTNLSPSGGGEPQGEGESLALIIPMQVFETAEDLKLSKLKQLEYF